MNTRLCNKCKRQVTILSTGQLATHGPGPRDEFICPGSGDKGMVKAAAHIKVTDAK